MIDADEDTGSEEGTGTDDIETALVSEAGAIEAKLGVFEDDVDVLGLAPLDSVAVGEAVIVVDIVIVGEKLPLCDSLSLAVELAVCEGDGVREALGDCDEDELRVGSGVSGALGVTLGEAPLEREAVGLEVAVALRLREGVNVLVALDVGD